MMNAPTNDYGHHRLSNFNDSEQSLRRSFFAIHRPNSPTTAAVQNPASSSANNNNNNGSAAVGYGGRRGAQMMPRLQKQSSSRRLSVETTLTSRDVSMLPSLPFSSKAEILTNHPRPPPPHRSRERGDANGRRRSNEQHGAAATSRHRQPRRSSHTGITADTAQGMITEIVNTNRDKNKDKSSHHREPPRRVTVSFAPSDEQLQRLRQSQGTAYQQHALPSSSPRVDQHVYHKGFRPDYVLGESSRHTSHMIVPQDDTHAITLVNTLSKHDFAWVKRSNGKYSYAILAYRTSSTDNDDKDGNNNKGEGMAFVMDELGSTKMIRKKYWCEYVRLVRPMQEDEEDDDNDMDCGMEGMLLDPSTHCRMSSPDTHQDQVLPQDHSKEDVVLCQEIQDDNEKYAKDAPLPEMIAFKPQEINDECSMISSVSDKVRKAWRKSWIESWDDM